MAGNPGKKRPANPALRMPSDKRIDLSDLTEEDKQLAREMWIMIEQEYLVVSSALWKELFERFPHMKLYFAHILKDGDWPSSGFRNHMVENFMPSIRQMLWSLDSASETKAYMEDLGKRHKIRGLKPGDVESLRRVFIFVLRDYLGSHVTDNHTRAMDKVMKATFSIFADQLRDVTNKIT